MLTHTFTNSSNLVSAAHIGGELFIKFHHGGVYKYADPMASHFHGLLQAESAGKYFHAMIKPLSATKVEALPA